MAMLATSRHDRFKQSYGRTLRLAFAAACALVVLAWFVLPEYRPEPYQLPSQDETVMVADIQAVTVEVKQPQATTIAVPKTVEAAPDATTPVETVPDLEEFLPVPVREAPAAAPAAPAGTGRADASPVIVYRAQAEYPETARQLALEGVVTVKVHVASDGSVTEVALVSGVHRLLDRAALAAARRCRFAPAYRNGKATDAWVALPYRFELR